VSGIWGKGGELIDYSDSAVAEALKINHYDLTAELDTLLGAEVDQ
jgi:hypothetical protein